MIILNRKRISFVIIAVMIGIASFLYKNQKYDDEIVKQTTSTPISNKVIVLDAGHGAPDERSSKQ